MQTIKALVLVAGFSVALPSPRCDAGVAADVVSTQGVARLPVKEVTVFKDGHAFLLHQGAVPLDAQGRAVLDYLPSPVMGTFWTYSAEKNAKLVSVVAGQRRMEIERTALTLRELLEANAGAEVVVIETNHATCAGTILGFPTRTAEELAATSPPNAGERLPQKGNLVLLKTSEGIRAMPIDRIQEVTFRRAPGTKVAHEEFRQFLTLHFEGAGRAGKTAEVGWAYLQRGIRWIPSYRVDLDGQGNARIKLQATLLNELTDLQSTTLHLVIGVPTFYFQDTLDPMALQETAAQLSSYFQSGSRRNASQSAMTFLSNAIMTQTARMGESRGMVDGPGGGGPDLPEGARNEDLFVFTIRNISLKKGERMVLPIAECTVPYEDVFVLDLPFAPPPELARNLNTQQQAELARLFAAPKVMHKARLTNKSDSPFTTAPALILREGRVVAQGLMTYTAIGASTDLGLTAAVDIQVKKTDSETKRTPNALQQNSDHYLRVDLKGTIRLTNHRGQPLKIEVTRHVLGHVDSADHDGAVEMSNVFESRDYLPVGDAGYSASPWWNWFNWPWWWHQVNGVGQITWHLDLAEGEKVELGYTWHYYWR